MRRLGLYIAVAALGLLVFAGSASADTITLTEAQLHSITPAGLGANTTTTECASDPGQQSCFARFTGTALFASQSFGASHLTGLGYTAGVDNFALTIINSNGSVWSWTIKVFTDDGTFTETASFGPSDSHTFVISLGSGSSIQGIEIIAGGPIPNTSTGSNDRLVNFDVLAATGQFVSVPESGTLSLLTVGLLAAGLTRRRKQ
jgi:hypothetical protein